jgi:Xaa-Pro aminopeptidase
MAPIDRNLIEPALLTADELKWLNDYHAEVRKNILPGLEKADPKAAEFLKKATEPLRKPEQNQSNIRKIKGFFL